MSLHTYFSRITFCTCLTATLTVADLGHADTCKPHWDNTIGLPGADHDVYALTLYNGDLIAGGQFTEIGGVVANRIARWDGTAWHPIGSGVGSNRVLALTVYNGELVAGGQFSSLGNGMQVNGIARWDGEQWLPFGDNCPAHWQDGCGMGGQNRHVVALEVYDGDLIAAGAFTLAGGVPVNHIARWDGTDWHPLGDGVESFYFPLDLAVYDGDLIAVGEFRSAGRVPAEGIARWNGVSWQSMPGLADVAWLSALTVHNGELIAAGDTSIFICNPCGIVARWNGSTWNLMNGLNGGVRDLATYDGQLFAAGQQIGPAPNAGLAQWDGASWQGVGEVDGQSIGTVNALAVYDGKLIVGGEFNPSLPFIPPHTDYIAAWDGCLGPTGDLNGDDSVGVPDLLILLKAWGECESNQVPTGECAGFCGSSAPSGCYCDEFCDEAGDCCTDVCDGCNELAFCPEPPPSPCPADLNNDGNVGVADLLILLANWG